MDSTERFSSRVADYVRYRPGYPPAVFELLEQRCGLEPGMTVCDLGSGTGISSKPLLERGARVFAVEPNAAMRAAAESALGTYPGFVSVAATAEATTLDPQSIQIALAAQAFHWFDRERTRRELQRILRPDAWLVLVWNERLVGASPFLIALEAHLQRRSAEYTRVRHQDAVPPSVVADFFAPARHESATFENRQLLDWEGLEGRLRSASYAPQPGQSSHDGFFSELRQLFEQHATECQVTIEYATRVYFGRLG